MSNTMRVLRGEDDWWALAGASGWRPRGATEAFTACGELGTVHSAHPLIVAYANTSSGLFPLILPRHRDRLVRRIHPPRAVHADDGGWDATVWLIELQWLVRQRCHFPSDAQADEGVRVTRSDTLHAPVIAS